MTLLLFGLSLVMALCWAYSVMLTNRIIEKQDARIAGLIDQLAIRTAATPAEAVLQARRPAPTPVADLSDEGFRRAHRGVSPMGL